MHIPKSANRLVGQAMHTYNMLTDGDSVLVAVSGGVDSMTLAAVLHEWRKKTPIAYTLTAVHLDMGFASAGFSPHARRQLAGIGIEVEIESTTFGADALQAEKGKGGCFHCARNRRSRLFSLAREKNCNKLALGHHKEDIIETFFLNLMYSGNISTMVPSQPLFNGKLTIIRPFAFLDKKQIQDMACAFGLEAAENPCPLTGTSKRERIRKILNILTNDDIQIKSNIFSALANVRNDYLLHHPLSS